MTVAVIVIAISHHHHGHDVGERGGGGGGGGGKFLDKPVLVDGFQATVGPRAGKPLTDASPFAASVAASATGSVSLGDQEKRAPVVVL